MLNNPNTWNKFPSTDMYFTSLKLDLILASAAAPAWTFNSLFHFWEDLIWIQIAWEGAEVQKLRWDTDYEHENHFLHLFAENPPSFCQISQLFHELFQKCKKGVGAFFSDSSDCNWAVIILTLHLLLMTFDSSLCVCSRAEWVYDQ